jgi:hypothetical protein
MTNTPRTHAFRFRIVQAGIRTGVTALSGLMLGCGAGAPAGPSLTPAISATPATAALSVIGVAPSIASIAGNSRVSIYGTGFVSGATVTFDGIPATGVTVVDSRSITVVTPAMAAAKKVDVVVINADGQRAVGTASFTYAVYSLTPSANTVAPGGQLSVSWTASTGQRNDYIEFYRVGDANANALWWIGTGGAASGTVTLGAPQSTGAYEFRYVLEDEVTDVARSSQVTVK